MKTPCGRNTKPFNVITDGIVIIVPQRVKSRVHASPFTESVHRYSRNAGEVEGDKCFTGRDDALSKLGKVGRDYRKKEVEGYLTRHEHFYTSNTSAVKIWLSRWWPF